ncbi:MAG TPA: DNA polymerase I [Tepidimicrobium sp.]|nr:DNA polymerase I [Tepidimicrobium sp.]
MDKKKRDRFMIIDGNSLLHRAFYALPLLSTKDGIYTNGVYGFLTMLYRIQEEYEADYLCVAFDKKGPTFRHEAYDQYKAHRDSTPDELAQQFPVLKEILSAMNIAQLEMDGYEADDIAGTLSRIGEEEGVEVILVTGDRDYLQLSSDKTKVLITRKGITELEEYDKNRIVEEYGITPEQFIDLKGLMGDSSDNIPGVPGIGEKTGIKFLKQFGSMENLYENIEDVRGKKTKESLIENKAIAFLSRKLGKIVRNAPIDISLEDVRVREPNWERLAKLYEGFEFRSLLSKIPSQEMEVGDADYNVKYKIVEGNDYEGIVKRIETEGSFAFKFLFEDDQYIGSDILGVGIKVGDDDPYYIDYSKNALEIFAQKFKEYFESEDIKKYGHMVKMDIFGLLSLNIDIRGIGFDTMIGQYILNPAQSNYSIDELGHEYLDIYGMDIEEVLGKGRKRKSYRDLPLETRAKYIAMTVDLIQRLIKPIGKLIEEQQMDELFYEIELPLAKVLAHMEHHGFRVDLEVLKQLGDEFQKRLDDLTQGIFQLAGEEFNINSPKQIGEILFDKLKLPVIKRTKTGYSTDAEVLDKLRGKHDIIEKILKYRQLMKLKSTYIDGLLNLVDEKDHRIHSTFNQTITSTGRISSTEPNLQNIPIRTEEGRKIRKAFVPDKGYVLVDGDYSQIELRVLAHISQDPKLMEAFHKDLDIHTRTASQVFHIPEEEMTPLMRDRAKAVNFGIIYGISDYGLSRDLNIPRKEAKEYIDKYLENYNMVRKYMEDIVKLGKEQGYVETIFHRRRYVPELKSKNYNVRSFGRRIALNTPIQGSAADIIKVAMVRVFRELEDRGLKSKLILQVHDELIIEAHKDEVEEVKELMQDIMEGSIKLDIPLKVDIEVGDSWYET